MPWRIAEENLLCAWRAERFHFPFIPLLKLKFELTQVHFMRARDFNGKILCPGESFNEIIFSIKQITPPQWMTLRQDFEIYVWKKKCVSPILSDFTPWSARFLMRYFCKVLEKIFSTAEKLTDAKEIIIFTTKTNSLWHWSWQAGDWMDSRKL